MVSRSLSIEFLSCDCHKFYHVICDDIVLWQFVVGNEQIYSTGVFGSIKKQENLGTGIITYS